MADIPLKDEAETGPASAERPLFVHAFGFRGAEARKLVRRDIEEEGAETRFDFVWIHLDAKSADAAAWARENAAIPPAAAEALFAGETRPRMTRIDGGLAVNLRSVNHNPGAEPEDMVSVRIWFDEKRVITTRRRIVRAIQQVKEIVEGPTCPRRPGDLVALIAAKLAINMEPYVDEVADAIDELEDKVLAGDDRGGRGRLADARRLAVQLRRYISPQREAINALAAVESALLDDRMRTSLRETSDAVTRMAEAIDAARERAMVLHDQIIDQRSEEVSRHTLILSTAAAVFLPLHFLVGLLGINVAGIPGADNPLAFWVVVGLALTLAAALIGFFKAKGWL